VGIRTAEGRIWFGGVARRSERAVGKAGMKRGNAVASEHVPKSHVRQETAECQDPVGGDSKANENGEKLERLWTGNRGGIREGGGGRSGNKGGLTDHWGQAKQKGPDRSDQLGRRMWGRHGGGGSAVAGTGRKDEGGEKRQQGATFKSKKGD